MFVEEDPKDQPVDKKYTKIRLAHLYPALTKFIPMFKTLLARCDHSHYDYEQKHTLLYNLFRRDIK